MFPLRSLSLISSYDADTHGEPIVCIFSQSRTPHVSSAVLSQRLFCVQPNPPPFQTPTNVRAFVRALMRACGCTQVCAYDCAWKRREGGAQPEIRKERLCKREIKAAETEDSCAQINWGF